MISPATHTVLHLDRQFRQQWISAATWGLIQDKKRAFVDLNACMEPSKQANLKHHYRQALNACRKAVLHDRIKYWQRLAVDLHRDFAQG
jgi:transposase